MNEIVFDTNCTFKEVLFYIEALKQEYKGVLASFSSFELHDKVLFMKEFKTKVYSFKFEEWRCNKIWEYLNDDETIELLLKLC